MAQSIIATYTGGAGAHYAKMRLGDGRVVELKSWHALDEAGWLSLAEVYEAAIAAADIEVEAEDGEVV